MKPAKIIWKNNHLAQLKSAKELSFNQGLNYGACIYEGVRCYQTPRGPAIFRLPEHRKRFFNSAKILHLPLPFNQIEFTAAVKTLIRKNHLTNAYLRPIAYYSDPKMGINVLNSKSTALIFAWPWKILRKKPPVRLAITRYRRLDPRTVNLNAKIAGYYANGLLGFLDVRQKGYDEPLFLDTKGYVAEGAVNNIFVIKGRRIYTPQLGPILSGITRNTIIRIARDLGYKISEIKMKPSFLKNADEIFLTGTGTELTPVSVIRGYFQPKIISLSASQRIQTYYSKIVQGEIKKYQSWLTFVKKNKKTC